MTILMYFLVMLQAKEQKVIYMVILALYQKGFNKDIYSDKNSCLSVSASVSDKNNYSNINYNKHNNFEMSKQRNVNHNNNVNYSSVDDDYINEDQIDLNEN